MGITITEMMKLTGEDKRGRIEAYRSLLQTHGILSLNQSMEQREVQTFIKAKKHKTDDITWNEAFEYAIQTEYQLEIKPQFFWTPQIIIKNLTWLIENKKVQYINVCDNNINPEEFHNVFDVIIDNFQYMGKTCITFKDSFGADGNMALTSAWKGEGYIYYLIGKFNHITESEDLHIFYNEGNTFNVMSCKYICGGSSKNPDLNKLWRAAVANSN